MVHCSSLGGVLWLSDSRKVVLCKLAKAWSCGVLMTSAQRRPISCVKGWMEAFCEGRGPSAPSMSQTHTRPTPGTTLR